MARVDQEERIALFLDYENLAIGAREHLGLAFDLRPVADALAERGRARLDAAPELVQERIVFFFND